MSGQIHYISTFLRLNTSTIATHCSTICALMLSSHFGDKLASGGKSTQIFYLSKSINTEILKYSVTSKRSELKMYLGKSTKVLASKCT